MIASDKCPVPQACVPTGWTASPPRWSWLSASWGRSHPRGAPGSWDAASPTVGCAGRRALAPAAAILSCWRRSSDVTVSEWLSVPCRFSSGDTRAGVYSTGRGGAAGPTSHLTDATARTWPHRAGPEVTVVAGWHGVPVWHHLHLQMPRLEGGQAEGGCSSRSKLVPSAAPGTGPSFHSCFNAASWKQPRLGAPACGVRTNSFVVCLLTSRALSCPHRGQRSRPSPKPPGGEQAMGVGCTVLSTKEPSHG